MRLRPPDRSSHSFQPLSTGPPGKPGPKRRTVTFVIPAKAVEPSPQPRLGPRRVKSAAAFRPLGSRPSASLKFILSPAAGGAERPG